MSKQFEELSVEELNNLSVEEVKQHIDGDYKEGVALIYAVMNEVKAKSGYKDQLGVFAKIWQLKKVKFTVWIAQTLLIIFCAKWIWMTSMLVGFTLALLAAIHNGNVNRICTRVQNHFDVLDGVVVNMDALRKFYYNQVTR